MLSFIWGLIVGGVAGWLAGKIMDSEGGVIRNVILGIVGGIVGSAVFRFFGFYGYGTIANLIISAVGACIVIWLGRLILGKK